MTEVIVCPEDHAHGEKSACYIKHKCRCHDCRRGRAEYEFWRTHMRAAGNPLLVDATGTHRRLRALGAIGWSGRLIALRYGYSQSWVSNLLEVCQVTPQTAERVRDIYDALSMSSPTAVTRHERGAVTKAKKWARDNGWPPPLAWDDDTIDDPAAEPATDWMPPIEPNVGLLQRRDETIIVAAIRGERPKMSPPERRAVIAQLHERRWSGRRISSWIGCSTRTVERIRDELDLESYDQAEITAA